MKNMDSVYRYNKLSLLFSLQTQDVNSAYVFHVLISMFIFRQGLCNAGVLYTKVIITSTRHTLRHLYKDWDVIYGRSLVIVGYSTLHVCLGGNLYLLIGRALKSTSEINRYI